MSLVMKEYNIGHDLTTEEYACGVKLQFNSTSPVPIARVFLILHANVKIIDMHFNTRKALGKQQLSDSQINKLNKSKSMLGILDIVNEYEPVDKLRPTGELTITLEEFGGKIFDLKISLALFQKRTEKGKTSSGSCRVTQVICGSTCHMFLYSEVTKKVKRGAVKRLKEYCSDDSISVDSIDSCQTKRKKKKINQTRCNSIQIRNQISYVERSTQIESENTSMSSYFDEKFENMFADAEICNTVFNSNQFNPTVVETKQSPCESFILESGEVTDLDMELLKLLVNNLPPVETVDDSDDFLSESDVNLISQSSFDSYLSSNNSMDDLQTNCYISLPWCDKFYLFAVLDQ